MGLFSQYLENIELMDTIFSLNFISLSNWHQLLPLSKLEFDIK